MGGGGQFAGEYDMREPLSFPLFSLAKAEVNSLTEVSYYRRI